MHIQVYIYKETWQKTRMRVLQQLFLHNKELVLNEKTGKYSFKNQYPFKRGTEKIIKKKLLAGMPLYSLSKVDKRMTGHTMVFADRGDKNQDRWIFEDEYKAKGYNYPEIYSRLEKNDPIPEFTYEKYPNLKEELEYKDSNRYNSPYPFSLYYGNFVQINPYFRKYNYRNIHSISVEELRESKKLLPKDYNDAIVETFIPILEFFEDDVRFHKDSYYNWIDYNQYGNDSADKRVEEKFTNALTSEEKMFRMCQEYGIDNRLYTKSYDFFREVIDKNRRLFIADSKKIIEAFS